jgi:hypothetical protein
VGGDGWADVPGYRRAVARPRLFWQGGPGRSLLVTVGRMAEDREGGTLPGSLTPSGELYTEELATRRGDAGLLARFLMAGGRLLALRGWASFQEHRHRFGEVREEEVEAVGLSRLAPLPQDLAAERGWSASLDLNREPGELQVNASAFASTIRDPVQVEPGPGGLLVPENAPGGTWSWASLWSGASAEAGG